jgi:uncharacterized membrane protein
VVIEMMILVWVLIGFAVYYLVTNNKTEENKNNGRKDPVETLKLRYISGEIDEETYRRTLKVLND